ncbi:glycosyltransferase [Bradyrhizobium embrapense]
MLLLSPIAAAFAGAAFIVGLCFTVFPLLNPMKWYWRTLVLGTAALLSWRYTTWRFSETLAPLDWTADALFSWGFAVLEALTVLSSTIAFFILSRVKDRTAEADQYSEWWLPGEAPHVDVFITTYNEPSEVLERTIVGATEIRYPRLRIFVLDDGARNWVRQLCELHEIGYLARANKEHAKAGNINPCTSRARSRSRTASLCCCT